MKGSENCSWWERVDMLRTKSDVQGSAGEHFGSYEGRKATTVGI